MNKISRYADPTQNRLEYLCLQTHLLRPYLPEGISIIIGHQKGAVGQNGDARRTAVYLAGFGIGHVAGQKAFHFSAGLAIGKWYEHYLVACQLRAVPGAMLPYEGPTAVFSRELVLSIECQTQGCRM